MMDFSPEGGTLHPTEAVLSPTVSPLPGLCSLKPVLPLNVALRAECNARKIGGRRTLHS